MNKRKKISKEQVIFLKNKGIPEMWDKNYAGEIVQIDEDLLVCLGGQGHMDKNFNNYSDIELFWGGVINDIPFVVTSFFYEEKIDDINFKLYLKILEFRVKRIDIDKAYFIDRFRKMVLDFGMDLAKYEMKDCQIVNKPVFKQVINL